MPGASLLLPGQRATGVLLSSLTEQKSQKAIFPTQALCEEAAPGVPTSLIPSSRSTPRSGSAEPGKGEGGGRGSTGHLPCDSRPNLVPGALAKALCLSDAGARAARAAPCKFARCKTSLELPGCDGEMAAKVSRARLMVTSLSRWPHP